MTQSYISLQRSPDGSYRERRIGPFLRVVELPPAQMRQAWNGIKRTDPGLADALTSDPVLRSIIQRTGATPCFTPDEFSALMTAGRDE